MDDQKRILRIRVLLVSVLMTALLLLMLSEADDVGAKDEVNMYQAKASIYKVNKPWKENKS